MKMFTEEQVKELLGRQRENCHENYDPYKMDGNLILNAPEPELPEVEEQEPYAWVDVEEQVFLDRQWYRSIAEHKKGVLRPLYLNPPIK